MKLKEIARELREELNFPYQLIKVTHNLSDAISIRLSQQPRNEWPNGYIENTKHIKLLVFCNARYEKNSESLFHYDSYKLRSVKKPITGQKLIKTLTRELKKWQE